MSSFWFGRSRTRVPAKTRTALLPHLRTRVFNIFYSRFPSSAIHNKLVPDVHRFTSKAKGHHPTNINDIDYDFDSPQDKLPSEPALINSPLKYISSVFSTDRYTIKEADISTFNRWSIIPCALAVHLSIGSVYAWSIFNSPLTRELGVVTSAAHDWSLTDVTSIFSVSILFLGLSAAGSGRWLDKIGPRAVGSLAGVCWGCGFIVAGVGISLHSLPLLYLGYGVLGGCGLGLGYISPVSTLLKWFPDRKGMATGLAIMGFGGGAMIATPMKELLLNFYFRAPTFVGSTDDIPVILENGVQFVSHKILSSDIVKEVDKDLHEIVIANNADLSCLSSLSMTEQLSEGIYLVSTGNSGCAATFCTLGVLYFFAMNMGAFGYRLPPPNYQQYILNKTNNISNGTEIELCDEAKSVSVNEAMKTPQFYQLWTVLFCNVSAGIGVLGVAKTMMSDIFSTSLPTMVDAKFAAFYVLMISVFNMGGRFVWASTSDIIGRKTTYTLFFTLGIPLYLSIPMIAHQSAVNPSVAYLVAFYASTMMIFSMYGGGFATLPAYLSDLFGTKNVGAIHGRLLTAWSAAGICGPMMLAHMRSQTERQAIHDLCQQNFLCGSLQQQSENVILFREKFGDDICNLDIMMNAKTVTISKLLEICPSSTIDPTPFLYDSTMYSTAGLLGIALIANLIIKPVDKRHFDI